MMKSIVYRLLLSVALVSGASACTQETEELAPEFFVKATKDGKAWLVPGEATYTPKRNEFYVFGRQDGEHTIQSFLRLGFGVPVNQSLATAVQAPARLHVMPATWVIIFGGDVLTDSYTQDSLVSRQIQITQIDTVQKIVEGTFEATLHRDARWSAPAETIRFTAGSFRLRYQQY